MAFAVKITDVENFYDLKARVCADGSKMLEGIDFTCSYSPTAEYISILIMLAYAWNLGWLVYAIDMSNAYQTVCKPDPSQRHYLSIPEIYMEWFRSRWPTHPLAKCRAKEVCLQSLRGIQGEKDAGNGFWELLCAFFINVVGMTQCVSDKATFTWVFDDYRSIFAVETDDVLMVTQHESCYHELRRHLDTLFEYTCQDNKMIHFLNLRIIQSVHGISVDHTEHIEKNILKSYWKDTPPDQIALVTDPFPTKSGFEEKIFNSHILSPQENFQYIRKRGGSLSTWNGSLQHVSGVSRPDLQYSTLRLATGATKARSIFYYILHHTISYLYHAPHLPIMYPRLARLDNPLHCHFETGKAEYIVDTPLKKPSLSGQTDADNGRDFLDRRSVSFNLWLSNQIIVAWETKKQVDTALHSNGAEVRSLFSCVLGTNNIRKRYADFGERSNGPIPIAKDNQATITEVLKDRLTASVRHLDVLITYLHEQKLRRAFTPVYTSTKNILADFGTKPLGGDALKAPLHQIIGVHFYPPSSSNHYKLLQLDIYNIRLGRYSQRKR